MVRRLADARLVVTGYDQQGGKKAELAHSVLISHWPRLRNWLSEDRGFRLWQEDMRSAMMAWEAGERDPGALLRGARLAEAERWTLARRADIPEHVLAYIMASLAGIGGTNCIKPASQKTGVPA